MRAEGAPDPPGECVARVPSSPRGGEGQGEASCSPSELCLPRDSVGAGAQTVNGSWQIDTALQAARNGGVRRFT